MASKILWLSVLFSLTYLSALGCNESCVNDEVTAFFEEEVSIIEENLGSDYIVGGRSMIAVFILQEITGIKSAVRFGDTSTYPNFGSFSNDKSRWKEWIKENGCELDVDHVKSILQQIKEKHPYLI